MSDGAFRYFSVAVFGTALAVYAADPPKPPAEFSPTGIITNTAPLTIGNTNGTPPIVVGDTNSVLTVDEQKAMEREATEKTALKAAQEAFEKKIAAEKKKWEDATNKLGVYHVIPGKDPFRLIKPKIEKPSVGIVARPITFGVPHLAGISLLNGVRAVLRVNPPRGGKAHYVRLQEGEMLQDADGNNYGEVLKIDKDRGIVEVKVKGQTFPLEIDRTKMMASRSKTSSRKPSSGSTSRWSRGRTSSSGNSSSKTGGTNSRGSSSKPPAKPGGSLQTVPSRRRTTGSLDKIQHGEPGLYELPAFNEAVQKLAVDPLDISAQREIIRGQFSYETPTDLPPGQR